MRIHAQGNHTHGGTFARLYNTLYVMRAYTGLGTREYEISQGGRRCMRRYTFKHVCVCASVIVRGFAGWYRSSFCKSNVRLGVINVYYAYM